MKGEHAMTLAASARNLGWLLLLGVALMVVLTAPLFLLSSGQREFEGNTGITWTEFSQQYPTVALQYALMRRNVVTFSLVFGLFSVAVSSFAFRVGQRWAWFTMWLLPAAMAAGGLSLAQNANTRGVALMGGLFILAAVAGLLLAIPGFFRKRE
jgi:hypothetical protein